MKIKEWWVFYAVLLAMFVVGVVLTPFYWIGVNLGWVRDDA